MTSGVFPVPGREERPITSFPVPFRGDIITVPSQKMFWGLTKMQGKNRIAFRA